MFQPAVLDGAVEMVTGWRVWLVGGWSDAVAIRSETDAKAFRCDDADGVVWNAEGALVEVPGS